MFTLQLHKYHCWCAARTPVLLKTSLFLHSYWAEYFHIHNPTTPLCTILLWDTDLISSLIVHLSSTGRLGSQQSIRQRGSSWRRRRIAHNLHRWNSAQWPVNNTEIWERHRHEAPLGYYTGRIFTEFQLSDRQTVRSCTGWGRMLVLSSFRARDFWKVITKIQELLSEIN